MSEHNIEWMVLAGADYADSQEANTQLEKFAQRRGFLDWLHEKVNVPRRMAETFSTVYGDVMNTLRDVDDRIRREYAVNLNDHVKGAKKALKDRRYLDIVHFLSEFNEDLKKISEQGKLLHQLRGEQIDDFYGDNLYYDWSKDYFKTASVKTAGIMDFFQPLGRPMAGRILERMYHNTLRERYRNMESLINEARSTANFVLNQLKAMGSARARGDVSEYLKHLDEIAKRRQRFENFLRQRYDADIKPMVERMREQRAQEEQEAQRQLKHRRMEPVPAKEKPRLTLEVQEEESPQLELPFWQARPAAPAPVATPAPTIPEPEPAPTITEPVAAPAETVQEPAAALPEIPSEIAIETETEGPQIAQPPVVAPVPAAAKAPPRRKPSGKAPTRRAPPKAKQVAPPEPPAPAGTQRAKRPSRKTVRQVAKAMHDDTFALHLLKQAKDQKSKETLRDLLLVFSAELDEIGEIDASLKCMAIAEGLLDG